MTTTMRSSRVASFVLLLAACGGEALNEDPQGPAAADAIECYGDPDMGGVICRTAGELWDCTTMPNGDVKCRKTGFTPPSGGADWSCTWAAGKIVCTAPGNVPGGSGWTCTSNGKTTTCSYNSSTTPPGGGSWTCEVTEFGLTCNRPAGSPGPGSGSGTGGSGMGTGLGSSMGTGVGGGSGSGSGTGSGGSGGGSGSGSGTGGSGSGSGTPGFTGFGCSYAMFVFTYQGKTYVMKLNGGAVSCVGENNTSHDASFSYSCHGHTYDNGEFVFHRDGAAVAPFPGSCPSLFTFTSKDVTAAPGVVILYGVVHNGSFPNHFASLCPANASGATSFTFPSICSD